MRVAYAPLTCPTLGISTFMAEGPPGPEVFHPGKPAYWWRAVSIGAHQPAVALVNLFDRPTAIPIEQGSDHAASGGEGGGVSPARRVAASREFLRSQASSASTSR